MAGCGPARLLIGGGGIWGGAALQRSQGSTSSTSSLRARLRRGSERLGPADSAASAVQWLRRSVLGGCCDRDRHRGQGLDSLRHQCEREPRRGDAHSFHDVTRNAKTTVNGLAAR